MKNAVANSFNSTYRFVENITKIAVSSHIYKLLKTCRLEKHKFDRKAWYKLNFTLTLLISVFKTDSKGVIIKSLSANILRDLKLPTRFHITIFCLLMFINIM